MRAISSLRDITMRVLIISAILACVSSAPSHYAVLPFAAIAVGPTVPPGDIQAAVIDAQVKVADQTRYIADQARELAEQAVENQNEGIIEANDLVKEKSEEAFWAAEEKKWQALNDAQIAAARIDSSVVSNIGAYPVGVVAGVPVAPGVTEVKPAEEVFVAKAVSEVAPIVAESPAGDSAVAVNAAESDDKKSAEVKSVNSEEKSEIKAVEIEKPSEEKPVEEKKDELADVKSVVTEALKEQNIALQKLQSSIFPAPVAVAPGFNYQAIAPISYQSAFRAYPVAAIQPPFGHLYPTVIKSVW